MPLTWSSTRERRLWLWSGLCLLTIYATLYPVRPLATWLRERDLLRLTVAALFVLAAVAAVRWSVARRAGGRELAVLAGVGAAYLAVLWPIRLPEERFHLLEYGLFAGLAYAALLERRRPGAGMRWSRRPAALAVLLTGAAGWLDEGLQFLLPNRYYDWVDVGLNLGAGALAVAALGALAEARRADRAARVAAAGS